MIHVERKNNRVDVYGACYIGSGTPLGHPLKDLASTVIAARGDRRAYLVSQYKYMLNMELTSGSSIAKAIRQQITDIASLLTEQGHVTLYTDDSPHEPNHAEVIAEMVVGQVLVHTTPHGGHTLQAVRPLAEDLADRLRPYCERIEIAGSIRRQSERVGDIEIVCIPRKEVVKVVSRAAVMREADLFNPHREVITPEQCMLVDKVHQGFSDVLNRMHSTKGTPEGKYTQRVLFAPPAVPAIKVDVFMATPENWGMIMAIRTGSANFSHALATRWVRMGYKSADGILTDKKGKQVYIYEEQDLFDLLRLRWVEPQDRTSAQVIYSANLTPES